MSLKLVSLCARDERDLVAVVHQRSSLTSRTMFVTLHRETEDRVVEVNRALEFDDSAITGSQRTILHMFEIEEFEKISYFSPFIFSS